MRINASTVWHWFLAIFWVMVAIATIAGFFMDPVLDGEPDPYPDRYSGY